MTTGSLERLQEQLKKLPGIGARTARKLSLYIIGQGRGMGLSLSDAIRDAIERYHHCPVCGMLTEISPCRFCADPQRENGTLCVVQDTRDVHLIDGTGAFQGRYFVLGGVLSPLDGIGPDQIRIPELVQLLKTGEYRELILALNPSTEGEATIGYLAELLRREGLIITRLSTGIPFGGDIEYTTAVTLTNALVRRQSID